jgi:hypothetical protein
MIRGYTQTRATSNYSLVAVFIAAGMFTEPLLSNERIHFTEPLGTKDRRDTHTD